MSTVKYISDAVLMTVPVEDNGEKMLYIPEHSTRIRFGYPTYVEDESSEVKKLHHYAREEMVKKLIHASNSLPDGVYFLVLCAYRPLYIQKKRYGQVWERIKNEHPDWNDEQIKTETDKWIAPLELIPPHSTGGAVDITLCREDGTLLPMGTLIGQASDKSPLESTTITDDEKAQREILKRSLLAEGFINYPPEWWHWSYGDRYWAAAIENEISIYDSVDMKVNND